MDPTPTPEPVLDPEIGSEPWPLWANLLLAMVVVSFSALFSGLTLGVMSLDKHGLEILMKGGDAKERTYAAAIYPIRKRGNLLLCTLLIGNTIANSFLSILLASVTSGVLGLVVSTSLIVIFGEIMPQSLCSRYGLYVGAKTRYITWFFIYLLSPLAWPVSKVLDLVLGREVGQSYDKEELKELIRIHIENPDAQLESGLTADDGAILHGALMYKDKRVSDVMTPLDRVFMLEASLCLDYDVMLQIYKSGYTRIPVYEGDRNRIIGMLYSKDLILIDPADEIELRSLVSLRGSSNVKYVLDSTPLGECFKTFKGSFIHMLVAVSLKHKSGQSLSGRIITEPFDITDSNVLLQAERVVSGVITLEDVLEEVIQAEIVDESDNFMSNDMDTRIMATRHNLDVESFLNIIHAKYRATDPQLTEAEVSAVETFLLSCVNEFMPFTSLPTLIRGLIRKAEVINTRPSVGRELESVQYHPREVGGGSGSAGLSFTRRASSSRKHPEEQNWRSGKMLFTRGEPADHFLIILQGKVVVRAGEEEFESTLGPWCTLGAKALTEQHYVPDYSAVGAMENLVVLKIGAWQYQEALDVVQRTAFGSSELEVSADQVSDTGESASSSHRQRQLNRRTSQIRRNCSAEWEESVPYDGNGQRERESSRADAEAEHSIRTYNEGMVKRSFSITPQMEAGGAAVQSGSVELAGNGKYSSG